MTGLALDFAIDLARQTGDLLLDFYRAATTQARLKADRSVVTDADLAADRLIADSIHRHFPSDTILSEELQPSLDKEADGAVWVVDPLDGTTNFSLGLPFWGISIARLIDGWPQTGVLYFPLLGELFTAVKGEGAHFNGVPLQVHPPDPKIPATFFSCCSRTFRSYEIGIRYKPRILGSAVYSFCAIARGMAIVAFEATPKIWDIAATWLLLGEAGGAVAIHHGEPPFPLQPGKDYTQAHFPSIAAATPELLQKAALQIKPKEN